MKKLKTVLSAFLLLAFSAASFCEIVTFQSGKETEDELLWLNPSNVIFRKGGSFERNDVSMIRFSEKAGAAVKAEAAAEREIPEGLAERSKELFSRAAGLLKKYPDAQALVLDDEGEFFYKADGTTRSRYVYSVMALKEEAKKSFGQVTAYETKGRTSARILSASVYCPGGKIYPLDPSKIQKTEPQSAEKFFSAGGRYLIYQLPGFETGCIADYEIESEDYNPYKKEFFFPSWTFQTTFPVARSEIKITIPEDKGLTYAARNFTGSHAKFSKPEISEKGGNRTYLWRVSGVPPIIPENDMPPLGDVSMNLTASILGSWDEIFKWTNKLYRERSVANEKLREFTLELIKDCKTEEGKAAKIYHYVQKEVRYIAIKVGIGSGIGGYDANLTWERKWGCCVDKALLLSAMLNVAGIENSPILIATNDHSKFDTGVPELAFNHAISVIYTGGKKIFLDSTNYDYRFPQIASFDYGVNVLNIFKNSIDRIPSPLPSENAGFYDYSIEIDSRGGISVSETMKYAGSREAELRGYYRNIKETEQRHVFERMVKSVSPKARLEEFRINNAETLEEPFFMYRKYSVEDHLQKAGDILIFEIPDFEMSPGELNEVSLNERKFPIEKRVTVGAYSAYRLFLPENAEIISMPEKAGFENKHLSFRAGCEKKSGGELFCFKELEKKSRIIPASDYAGYKALLEKIANYTRKNVYFKIAGK